jgi:hypothetical protein
MRYASYTFPTFFIGLFLAFFFPSLDLLVNCLTFFTTPWVTMVYPAALYWKVFRAGDPGLLDATTTRHAMGAGMKLAVVVVVLMGLVGFVISLAAALGMLAIDGTSDWQIGCEGWYILKPKD